MQHLSASEVRVNQAYIDFGPRMTAVERGALCLSQDLPAEEVLDMLLRSVHTLDRPVSAKEAMCALDQQKENNVTCKKSMEAVAVVLQGLKNIDGDPDSDDEFYVRLEKLAFNLTGENLPDHWHDSIQGIGEAKRGKTKGSKEIHDSFVKYYNTFLSKILRPSSCEFKVQ